MTVTQATRQAAVTPNAGAISRRRPDAWDVLDRFGQELQTCQDPTVQQHLFARAVRDCTAADVGVYVPGPGGCPGLIGTSPFQAYVYERLVPRLVGAHPHASHLLLGGCEDLTDGSPQAFHAALVRVHRAPDTWIAAFTFSPERRFEEADFKPIRLARRFFLNHEKHSRTQTKLKDTLFGLIHCLTEALEAKDPNTCGHSERVGRMAARLGQEMKLAPVTVSDLYLAGLLHDIGKIGVRDAVLSKPDVLTPEEEAHIHEHTIIGDRIVAPIKEFDHLRPGVRSHHERFDGKGYPDGLIGEEIPHMARVLAVADACDAMMHDRPYRSALSAASIEETFRAGAGSQWDPDVVRHFMACRHDLYPICERGLGESVARSIEQHVDNTSTLASAIH